MISSASPLRIVRRGLLVHLLVQSDIKDPIHEPFTSMSMIMSMRRWWRSSNFASRNVATQSTATTSAVTREPRQSTFALLCSFANFAVRWSCTRAALTPLNLFATMLIPMPVPQMRMTRSILMLSSTSLGMSQSIACTAASAYSG